MTTSKIIRRMLSLPLLLAASVALGTESSFSVPELNYYRLNIKDKPVGVYEWESEGVLFVQVKIPYSGNESPEQLEEAELRLTNHELFAWLVRTVGKRKNDPELAYGADFARRLVRECYPQREYSKNWKFDGETRVISRDEQNQRVCAMVCKKRDVLASVPASFADPVSKAFWYEGIHDVISEMYVGRGDLAFMWRIGALDCLDVSCDSQAVFPKWDDSRFSSRLSEFLVGCNVTWKDVESPAHDEYEEVRKQLVQYLISAGKPLSILSDARSLVEPEEKVSWHEVAKVPEVSVNTNVRVLTNAVSVSNITTNSIDMDHAKVVSEMAVVPFGGRVSVNSVTSDEEIIEVVTTETRVTTEKKIRRKTVSLYKGEPRFEMLFLSSGCLPNAFTKRSQLGHMAEKEFCAPSSFEKKERIVVSALRENPGDKGLWNLYGRLFQSRKDWMGALVCFRNALRIDREYEFALTNMAETYQAMGKKRLSVAMALLARGVATDPWCISHSEAVLDATW